MIKKCAFTHEVLFSWSVTASAVFLSGCVLFLLDRVVSLPEYLLSHHVSSGRYSTEILLSKDCITLPGVFPYLTALQRTRNSTIYMQSLLINIPVKYDSWLDMCYFCALQSLLIITEMLFAINFPIYMRTRCRNGYQYVLTTSWRAVHLSEDVIDLGSF